MTLRLVWGIALVVWFHGMAVAAEPVASAESGLRVRMQDSGTIAGRLQILYPTGKSEPADASVAFSRNGDLVGTAQTDENGEFQMDSLQPGAYTATAVVDKASTDFQVLVMAYDPAAPAKELMMQGTLTPVPADDMVLSETPVPMMDASVCETCGGQVCGPEVMCDNPCSCQAPVDEVIVEEEVIIEDDYAMMGACGGCCSGGFSSGGCCGGGGAIGGRGLGLLGLGGLAAGITALAIDDDDPVSPFRP